MTRALIRSKREFRARVDRAAFSFLIATPVAGAFTMPASGKISFITRVDTIEGDDIATVQGATLRELKSPGAVAGMRMIIDHIEKDATVAVVQNVDVYLDNGLGVWSKIAEGAA